MYLTRPVTDVDHLINDKHKEYVTKAIFYSALYYTTRVVAGLSAALLPFIVGHSQLWATILAIVVAVVTVFDSVFAPKDRWALYSKATDLLALATIRAQGTYDKNKDAIDTILQTESANLQTLRGRLLWV